MNKRYIAEYSPEELQEELNSKLKTLKVHVTQKTKRIICTIPADVIPGRDAKWWEECRRSYLREVDFLQEQKVCWVVYRGSRVISNFNPAIHHQGYPGVMLNRPLKLGFDWGGQHAAYRISQEDKYGRWIQHTGKTLTKALGDDVDPDEMMENLKKRFSKSGDRFYNPNGWEFEIVMDVSGTYENPQGIKNKRGESIILETVKFHFPKAKIHYHKINVKQAVKGLDQMFRLMKATLPAIIISPKDKETNELFSGGWHYPEKKKSGKLMDEPEDDGYWIHQGDIELYEWWAYYKDSQTKHLKTFNQAPEPKLPQQHTPNFNLTD